MKEADYNNIAKYYDRVIGKGNDSAYVKNKIKSYNKEAKSLLELGCGTGSNLDVLQKDFKTAGIDISGEMLKIAKKKVPGCDFYLQDICRFKLKEKFDVIICIYDTINHLTLFSQWKDLFVNVNDHLNENGLFIFDINTVYKLQCISDISPLVYKFDSNHLIIDVKKISANVFNWNLKIFESRGNNNFKLFETNIKESSFDVYKILGELRKHFALNFIEDERKRKINDLSERIYFVYKKKPYK